MIDRASYLVKRYGTSMTLKRTIPGQYHPDTGTTDPDTVTTHPCFGLIQFITRTSANQFYGTTTLKETLIQKDDEMCFLSAKELDVVPKHPTDVLINESGFEYNVIFVTPLKSGSSNVLYVMQIRK